MVTIHQCDRCGVQSPTAWCLNGFGDFCLPCQKAIRNYATTRPATTERAHLQIVLTSLGVDKKLRAEAAYTAFQTHLHGNNFLMSLPWESSLNQAAWFAVIDRIDEIVQKAIQEEQAAKADAP